jgi:peptidoglycan/xylan/chitin deacetylase (PgdA/CDA1 family)
MNKAPSITSYIVLILMISMCVFTSFGTLPIVNAQKNNDYYYMPKDSPIFWSGPNSKKEIALSFDDGPDPIYTPKILNILSKYNVKATFFLVGEQAKLHPQLVQRIIADGHEIGSHTMTHPNANNTPPPTLKSEVMESVTYLQNLTSQEIRFFRPPYGILSPSYFSACSDQGITMILWSVDTVDWERPSFDIIVERVISQIGQGSIILMHDGGGNRQQTVDALDKILCELEQMQLRPVTLSKLFFTVPE